MSLLRVPKLYDARRSGTRDRANNPPCRRTRDKCGHNGQNQSKNAESVELVFGHDPYFASPESTAVCFGSRTNDRCQAAPGGPFPLKRRS